MQHRVNVTLQSIILVLQLLALLLVQLHLIVHLLVVQLNIAQFDTVCLLPLLHQLELSLQFIIVESGKLIVCLAVMCL
jgi:hypothetical protein